MFVEATQLCSTQLETHDWETWIRRFFWRRSLISFGGQTFPQKQFHVFNRLTYCFHFLSKKLFWCFAFLKGSRIFQKFPLKIFFCTEPTQHLCFVTKVTYLATKFEWRSKIEHKKLLVVKGVDVMSYIFVIRKHPSQSATLQVSNSPTKKNLIKNIC